MPTAKWRMKSLPLEQWTALQEHFARLLMATGAPPNLAMFSVHRAGQPESAIYITGPGIEAIESRSPGGWQDADAPSGNGVALLVGQGDPWTYFGIEKPA